MTVTSYGLPCLSRINDGLHKEAKVYQSFYRHDWSPHTCAAALIALTQHPKTQPRSATSKRLCAYKRSTHLPLAMPSVPSTPSTSRAGIATSSTGDRHIPSSTRPDGSVRKEIRVRPGYRPPEDVEIYKNRTAQAWNTRGSAGVPGAATVDLENPRDSPSKSAKRREARKKAAAPAVAKERDDMKAGVAKNLSNGAAAEAALTEMRPEGASEEGRRPVDPEAEKEKEAKKLAKRLRQARELKAKKEEGAALLPEQFEKVFRINELIRQLDSLGFGPDGEKKNG